MRRLALAVSGVCVAGASAAAGSAAGCANVLGIPNDSPSFCAQPANQGHDYCEDFDVGDPSTRWTFAEATPGAAYAVRPSDKTGPNLIDFSSPGASAGSTAIAAFDEEFDDSTFVGLHVEADVRFVTANGAPIDASGGFLLIADKSGGCIGLGIGSGAPDGGKGEAMIGAVVFPTAASCTLLANGGIGGSDAPISNNPLTPAPAPNTWFHMVVVVAPGTGDGTGTLTFNIVGQPGSVAPVTLPSKTLPPGGIPFVGFAAQVNGPSGPFEVQFDDITIDLRPD